MEANIENKYIVSDKKKPYSSPPGVGASAGIICGMLLLFIGLVLWLTSYLEDISFHGIDSLMLVASFVLLLAGAHFLDVSRKDLIDEKKEKLNL